MNTTTTLQRQTMSLVSSVVCTRAWAKRTGFDAATRYSHAINPAEPGGPGGTS